MAAPRPRVNTTTHQAYYPSKYTQWKQKAMVLLMASNQIPKRPIEGCSITCVCIFKRLKQHSKRKTPGRIKKITRPDNDNLEKGIWDVLQTVGVIAEDGKIWENTTRKFFAAADESPHIEIEIIPLPTTPINSYKGE